MRPGEIDDIFLQIREPELWEQRGALRDEVRAVRGSRGTYAAADEEEARPLDAEEWRQVLLALGWVDERADDGVVQREARRAQKLLREAKMAQPSARFEPAERQLARATP